MSAPIKMRQSESRLKLALDLFKKEELQKKGKRSIV